MNQMKLIPILVLLSLVSFSQDKIQYSEGYIHLNNMDYSVDSILKSEATVDRREDWIVFKNNETGWGPKGGNVFLIVDSSKLIYKEILNPWGNQKKILQQFEKNYPIPINISGNSIYDILGFYRNKLWFSIYEDAEAFDENGGYSKPKILGYADLVNEEFKYFTQQDFKFSHFIRIVQIDDKYILIGEAEAYFEREMSEKDKIDNIIIYQYENDRIKVIK